MIGMALNMLCCFHGLRPFKIKVKAYSGNFFFFFNKEKIIITRTAICWKKNILYILLHRFGSLKWEYNNCIFHEKKRRTVRSWGDVFLTKWMRKGGEEMLPEVRGALRVPVTPCCRQLHQPQAAGSSGRASPPSAVLTCTFGGQCQ